MTMSKHPAELPACYQNLDELVTKLRSKVGAAASYCVLSPDSSKTQSSAAVSTRQEPLPDYGAADDEFPSGTLPASTPYQRSAALYPVAWWVESTAGVKSFCFTRQTWLSVVSDPEYTRGRFVHVSLQNLQGIHSLQLAALAAAMQCPLAFGRPAMGAFRSPFLLAWVDLAACT